MKSTNTKYFVFSCISVLFGTASLYAQAGNINDITNAINEAGTNLRDIARVAGGILGSLVGFIGMGRTAWKLSQGDTDATNSIIMAIVGIALAFASVLLV